MYNKQGGYESILPFIYGVTDVFPEALFKNITTKHGLASLNADHPKKSTKYEYRSNIHSYFNYKLLVSSKAKLMKNEKKNNKHLTQINAILGNVRQWIESQWSKGASFTMWSAQGEGLKNKRQLSLINVALIGNK